MVLGMKHWIRVVGVLGLIWVLGLSGAHAQAPPRQQTFTFTNFDQATVSISLDIEPWVFTHANVDWFTIARAQPGTENAYVKFVKGTFARHQESLRFVYDMFANTLPHVSDAYFINTIIRFVQELPYQLPPMEYLGKPTSGLLPPPFCLAEGWGDCDTKSLLLACILGHRYEILFLIGEQHAFIGIQVPPGPHMEFVTIGGKPYVLCEMTDVWPLGQLPASSVRDINAGKYEFFTLRYH